VIRRRASGHALTEFTLLCSVIVAAWFVPWGEGPAAATRWLEAWLRWLHGTLAWMAGG
jgi:hypothetical protein